MILKRYLSGTLTVTETNDTDKYVIYEFDPDNYSIAGNVVTITPLSVFASPLVDSETSIGSTVCIDFDLFRGDKAKSASVTGTDNSFYLVDNSDYAGMVVEYVVERTNTGNEGTRTGQILAAWNGSNIQFTDSSTRDAGASTAGLQFKIALSGGNAAIGLTVTAGQTFDVTINVRPYGKFS